MEDVVVHRASPSSGRDTLGNEVTQKDIEQVQWILDMFPELIAMLTVPQIVRRWQSKSK
jgi:hypothetical protein